MVMLQELTIIRAPLERCFDLARGVEVHLAGNVHSGETAVAAGGVTSGLIGRSQRVTWRAKHLGVWQTLTSEITAMNRPAYFQDTMVRGAFRFMQHDHFFRAISDRQTEMKDVFRFAAPLPVLGLLAEAAFLGRYMRALLHERNVAIYDSRVRSTLRLNQVVASLPRPPRLWINASTATIYRHALDRAMDEATGELGGSEPGAPDTWNFSIAVAKGWEAAFFGTPTPL